MLLFLIPLLLGFGANLASAFTAAYSRRWGDEWGSAVTIALRGVFGIPLWVLGFALAVRQPAPALFETTTLIRLAAGLAIAAGAALVAAAWVSMRRRALLPSTHDTLEESGIYGIIRHPMDAGTCLGFVGLFLLIPIWVVGLACVLGLGWIALQTRFEEIDLLQRLPAYRDYMGRVPSLMPRLRKK